MSVNVPGSVALIGLTWAKSHLIALPISGSRYSKAGKQMRSAVQGHHQTERMPSKFANVLQGCSGVQECELLFAHTLSEACISRHAPHAITK
jgi:hypothetical protein